MFLGYSLKSKAYICFNYRTKTIVECENVRIDEKFGTKEKMWIIILMKMMINLEWLIELLSYLSRLTMTCRIMCKLKK